MTLLTALNLQKFSNFSSNLQKNWYLIAAATLTVCNKPDEIPKIYHFVLQNELNLKRSNKFNFNDLHNNVLKILNNFKELQSNGEINIPNTNTNTNNTSNNAITNNNNVMKKFNLKSFDPYDNLPDYKLTNEDLLNQIIITKKLRETILKSAALTGLPKAINALSQLRDTTPYRILKILNDDLNFDDSVYIDESADRDVKRRRIASGLQSSKAAPSESPSPSPSPSSEPSPIVFSSPEPSESQKLTSSDITDTTESPIVQKRKRVQTFEEFKDIQIRGYQFWKKIYGKVSLRVVNHLRTANPDLWNYAIQNVYAPLLSYTDILSAQETSLVIVACLVPQDVNPQLKGHLKGALNNKVDLQTVRDARELAIELSSLAGITWTGEVAKL